MLACPAEAGADPTCLPNGLRSAALTPWECPAGWRYDAERGCLPTIRTNCPESTGPLPDGSCTATGIETCPDAPYASIPEGADLSRVVYVDDDAAEGGDGSRERPFNDLSPVLNNALEGTTVLLAAGRYPLQAEVHTRVMIRGVCAPRVLLVPADSPPAESMIFSLGAVAHVTLEHLSARIEGQQLIGVEDGARATLRSVIGHGERRSLVGMVRARADLEEVVFSAGPPQRGLWWAAVYARSSEVRMRRVSALGSGALLGRLLDGGSAMIEDVAAVGVQEGINADPAGNVDAARVYVSGESGHGIWHLNGAGTYRDVVLDGLAARFAVGARITATRMSVRRGGLEVYEPGTEVTITDLAMTEVATRSDRGGNCAAVERTARLNIRRGRFHRCNELSVYGTTGGSLDLEDVLFKDSRPSAQGFLGVALSQSLGGESRIRRAVIDHAGMTGLASVHLSPSLAQSLPWEMWTAPPVALALRTPSRIVAQDVAIVNGESVPSMPSAGMFTGAHSTIEGERIAILHQVGVGILAGDSGFDRQYLLELVASGATRFAGLLPPFIDGPSTMRVRELFVGGVRPWRILFDPTTRLSQPDFVAAYGAYVSPRCALDLTNGYFDGATSTENALVSQGELTARGGVVTGTSRCAATRNSLTGGTVALDGVRVQGNGRDETCVDDAIPSLRIPMSPN